MALLRYPTPKPPPSGRWLSRRKRQGIADYESGKVHRMNEEESSEEFLARMINEG